MKIAFKNQQANFFKYLTTMTPGQTQLSANLNNEIY